MSSERKLRPFWTWVSRIFFKFGSSQVSPKINKHIRCTAEAWGNIFNSLPRVSLVTITNPTFPHQPTHHAHDLSVEYCSPFPKDPSFPHQPSHPANDLSVEYSSPFPKSSTIPLSPYWNYRADAVVGLIRSVICNNSFLQSGDGESRYRSAARIPGESERDVVYSYRYTRIMFRDSCKPISVVAGHDAPPYLAPRFCSPSNISAWDAAALIRPILSRLSLQT
jgi:hypothetical protein